ncbi:MAG TPA: ankyrin repeat domain-containing protein [Pyrinomonadaceae bacterium]|nr:ankyrin repeat domain-containing protein [Pyrinomonadaceae bacterium]
MAVPRKLVAVPNAATRELWRIAESGAIDELEDVLPQADINARNEHGMTALMRAAYHGRVQMVRVLLEHGADPNVSRNDNFTALSLAAFFGHAEIVDILMQRGANTNVATRFGTSPYLWAKARSFGDVARSLEKRNHEFKEPVPAVSSVPSVSPAVHTEPDPPIVVRTLKDPPEIWDLVHEAPRNYSASSAFMARMGSLKGAAAIAVVLFVVIAAGAGAAYWLKDTIRSSPVAVAPAANAVTTLPAPPATQPPATNNAAPVDVAPAPLATTEPPAVGVITSVPAPRRTRSFVRPRTDGDVVNDNNTATTQATVSQPPSTPTQKPESRAATEPETKNKTAPLSQQMIAPPKTSQPKAKVIQWP